MSQSKFPGFIIHVRTMQGLRGYPWILHQAFSEVAWVLKASSPRETGPDSVIVSDDQALHITARYFCCSLSPGRLRNSGVPCEPESPAYKGMLF